jgi:hypothetical protein
MNINENDMLDEYDFSKGIRGKYAKRYAEGTNIVVFSPDVAEFFPDHTGFLFAEGVKNTPKGSFFILKPIIRKKNLQIQPHQCIIIL